MLLSCLLYTPGWHAATPRSSEQSPDVEGHGVPEGLRSGVEIRHVNLVPARPPRAPASPGSTSTCPRRLALSPAGSVAARWRPCASSRCFWLAVQARGSGGMESSNGSRCHVRVASPKVVGRAEQRPPFWGRCFVMGGSRSLTLNVELRSVVGSPCCTIPGFKSSSTKGVEGERREWEWRMRLSVKPLFS